MVEKIVEVQNVQAGIKKLAFHLEKTIRVREEGVIRAGHSVVDVSGTICVDGLELEWRVYPVLVERKFNILKAPPSRWFLHQTVTVDEKKQSAQFEGKYQNDLKFQDAFRFAISNICDAIDQALKF